jgi:hypothetical protein
VRRRNALITRSWKAIGERGRLQPRHGPPGMAYRDADGEPAVSHRPATTHLVQPITLTPSCGWGGGSSKPPANYASQTMPTTCAVRRGIAPRRTAATGKR